MPSPECHRKQAEIFAELALSTSNANEANWYKLIAMEQLERARRDPGHDHSVSDPDESAAFPMTSRCVVAGDPSLSGFCD
jgi:hypothetical protein